MTKELIQSESELLVEELEELQAPGFWDGVALGGAFGAALGTGIGIGLAIT
ncbi:hypothetical protein GCM10009759_42710 [Kitasatospora saccharophila]|uniref:Lactobin A/cerein 7B family class IIb bacteriocin n=1 Tax=Kitasatospora saccharophila TaxID=407973 RepID=A0ABN2X7U6_9ACTN